MTGVVMHQNREPQGLGMLFEAEDLAVGERVRAQAASAMVGWSDGQMGFEECLTGLVRYVVVHG